MDEIVQLLCNIDLVLIYQSSHQTSLSHVSILFVAVGDRQWQTNSQKHLATKVRLSFLIKPLGSNTKSALSLSMDSRYAIHLLMDSLSCMIH